MRRQRIPSGLVILGLLLALGASPASRSVRALAPAHLTPDQAIAAAVNDLEPTTVDPEIGANDFRLSDMGGDVLFDASLPAVAYNSHDNEYLVVWCGDDDTGGLVDGESEIFGQRVEAATGAEIGADLRLSDMGPDGSSAYVAFTPAVAYNSANNEYLVVWYGDDDTAPLVDNETEIFGQRVNAATGAEIGANDFRLSDMGPDGNTGYSTYRPAVAYNPTNNEYLVVWRGDDDTGGLVNDEFEVFGQRVNAATGAEIGTDFRLSDMGPDGNANYDAYGPAVAYNSTNNQYLVVWDGDDNTGGLVDEEYEVFGQRVDAATGGEIGADFRLSDMGPDGNANYDADRPAVAYNSTHNQYLVVWEGDDNTGGLVDEEDEIFGQRVEAVTGAEIGAGFRLSDVGPNGDANYVAWDPAVTYNPTNNEYLVVWWGDDNTFPLALGEGEIFGQRVNAATGAEIGSDLRLSDMGPNGDANYDADYPVVAYSSTANEYLVVWYGDDSTAPLVDEEFEIFGQRVDAGTGAEVGANDFRLSDMGGDTLFDAFDPAVAYNSTDNEYLVVWSGDDSTAPLVDEEFEIWGQRVNAATGAEIGADFRLSDMGPDGNANYEAYAPAVAYNSTDSQYLVVWVGDDDTAPLVNGEQEVFGQRVEAATGAEIGGDFRLSDVGPDGDTHYEAVDPAVAYNSTDNQYLVVWSGDDDTAPLVNGEQEIFGQRVNGATGAEIGGDLRLSDMGPDGDVGYVAAGPAVTYNSMNNQYLVVWSGDDDTFPLVNDEFEVFGQRVEAATGAEIGGDFRLSDMGPNGNTSYGAGGPAVAYNSTDNQYLVVWGGDDNTAPLVNDEFEAYGQRLNAATGAEVGANDFRLSDMGPDGDPNYDASFLAVAYNSTANEYLVVWRGDDNTAPLVNDEYEVFGQRVDAATGAQIGADFRLSDMGPAGDPNYDAFDPTVAYNRTSNQYLVVWYGDDDTPPLVDGEYEVFGQRFAPAYRLHLPLVVRAH